RRLQISLTLYPASDENTVRTLRNSSHFRSTYRPLRYSRRSRNVTLAPVHHQSKKGCFSSVLSATGAVSPFLLCHSVNKLALTCVGVEVTDTC
ncbi:TPA: hypothetical protein ACWXHA_005795, partial [Klebsiella pneumoniae]